MKSNILKYFGLISLFLVMAFTSKAESLKIEDFTITGGHTTDVNIEVNVPEGQMFDYIGFQFDLFLPEGLTLESASLAPELVDFTLQKKEYGNGVYRFMGYSGSATPSNSKPVATLTLKASETTPTGYAIINIQNVVFSAANGQDVKLDNSTSTANVFIQAKGIEVSLAAGSESTILLGRTSQLVATVSPENATDKSVEWISDTPAVATVSDNGLVTGVGVGTATITATNSAGGTATILITVQPIVATSVKLSAEDLTLLVGQTDKLTATVSPANTTDQTVTWTSNFETIVKVNNDGAITAIAPGVATVTASCGEVSATCQVTVKGADDVTVKSGNGTTPGNGDDTPGNNTENGGSLFGNDLTLRVNQTAAIDLQIPEGLSVEPNFAWVLNNGGEELVDMTVADNTLSATFKGLKVGETGYTVSIVGVNGNIEAIKGKITVIAQIPMTSLELDPASITMAQNALPRTINPVYTPDNASMPEFSWTSSVPNVATVDNDGIVTPIGQGVTVITAKALDGSDLSATCSITVTAPIDENFGFDESVMGGVEGVSIYLGDSYTLLLKAHDGYQLPENISWSSSDDNTVSVDQNGKVTGLALGEANITASASVKGREVSASCKVTVMPINATTISIGKATLLEPSFTSSTASVSEITLGENLSVEVDLLPEGTTDSVEDIEWSFSGAEGIGLTMDGSGHLTVNTENAVIGGSPAEVTVTGTFGDFSASFTIYIKSVLLGDSNANGRVTVADVVTSAKVAVGNKDVDEFCFPNANVVQTSDSKDAITTQDITATVSIILDQAGAQRNMKRHLGTFYTNDRLVADDFRVSANGETSIGVRLDGVNDYSALQASVVIPEGMTVTGVTAGPRAAVHQIVYNVADGRVNLMLYSLQNASFAESDEPLFYLRTVAREDSGDLGFENVNASDAASNGYFLYGEGGRNVTGTTGVDAIETDEGVRYYDLNGVEIRRPDSGVYICIDTKGNVVKVRKH